VWIGPPPLHEDDGEIDQVLGMRVSAGMDDIWIDAVFITKTLNRASFLGSRSTVTTQLLGMSYVLGSEAGRRWLY